MGFYYETATFRPQSITEYTAPFSETFGASLSQAWHEGPVASLFALDELSQARTGRSLAERFIPGLAGLADEARGGPPVLSRLLSDDEAKAKINEAGLTGLLKTTPNMREAEVSLLIREKKKEVERKRTLSRADNTFATQAGLFGAGLIGTLADPINLATAFIPFVGPSRTAYMLGEAGSSALARGFVRARVGAIEGFGGTAITEPLVLHAMSEYQHEYGPAQIFMNLAFGTVLGGGLHVGAGAIMDRIARRGEFFRETGRYYDQAYSSFVNDYRGIATEYGFDTSLAGFQSRLTGRLGDGFFGPRTKRLFDEYVDATNKMANELGLPPPGRSPEDFMRWIDTRHKLRQELVPSEKYAEPPPPKEGVTPDYDVPGGAGRTRTFYAMGVKAAEARPVATLPVVDRLTALADEVPAQAREVGIWHAANRFVQGQVSDLRPLYQMYGAQKRLAEARELGLPEAQAIVRNFKGKDARVTAQLLDGRFTYKLDFGDTGPIAFLHPEGFAKGDKIEWSRFNVNQFGEGHVTTIREVKGDKAFVDGWAQPVPLSELKLIEAGPGARRHRLEIEWGDLGIELRSATVEIPAVAKLKGGDKLLQILRGDQKFDHSPVIKQFEHQDSTRADLFYESIDPRERALAMREADEIVSARTAGTDKPIPPPRGEKPTKLNEGETPTKGRGREDEPTRAPGDESPTKLPTSEEATIKTPVEDKQIADHDIIASQKADQHGLRKEYDDLMAQMDKDIGIANEKAYFMEHYTRCLLGEI